MLLPLTLLFSVTFAVPSQAADEFEDNHCSGYTEFGEAGRADCHIRLPPCSQECIRVLRVIATKDQSLTGQANVEILGSFSGDTVCRTTADRCMGTIEWDLHSGSFQTWCEASHTLDHAILTPAQTANEMVQSMRIECYVEEIIYT